MVRPGRGRRISRLVRMLRHLCRRRGIRWSSCVRRAGGIRRASRLGWRRGGVRTRSTSILGATQLRRRRSGVWASGARVRARLRRRGVACRWVHRFRRRRRRWCVRRMRRLRHRLGRNRRSRISIPRMTAQRQARQARFKSPARRARRRQLETRASFNIPYHPVALRLAALHPAFHLGRQLPQHKRHALVE